MKKFETIINEGKNKIPLTMNINTEFTTHDGVDIKIINITLIEMHKSKPKVLVSYNYDTGTDKGREDQLLETFAKNVFNK